MWEMRTWLGWQLQAGHYLLCRSQRSRGVKGSVARRQGCLGSLAVTAELCAAADVHPGLHAQALAEACLASHAALRTARALERLQHVQSA